MKLLEWNQYIYWHGLKDKDVEDMRIIENQVNAVNVRMRVNNVHENVIDSRELESRCITVPQSC